jgi:hypothetical protein
MAMCQARATGVLTPEGTPVRLVSPLLKDREAHAFHSWSRHAAEQRSRTRVSWRAASAVVILDGCESGGHYRVISVGSCPRYVARSVDYKIECVPV